MPEKFGQKALFMILNLLGSLAIMFIILAATNRIGKADVDYVDKQDAVIQKNLDDYKGAHQIQHSIELKSVDDKLDLIMEFWDIKYEKKRKGF